MLYNKNALKRLEELYPVGTTLRLIHMEDVRPVPPGTLGVVEYIDDAGQIHVRWDNGSSLALIPLVDDFRIVLNDLRNYLFKVDNDSLVICEDGLSFINYTFSTVFDPQTIIGESIFVYANNGSFKTSDSNYPQKVENYLNTYDRYLYEIIPDNKLTDMNFFIQYIYQWLLDTDNNMVFTSDWEDGQDYLLIHHDEIESFVNRNLLHKVFEPDEDGLNWVVYPSFLSHFNIKDWDQNQNFEQLLLNINEEVER